LEDNWRFSRRDT
jgi:hypothetical protein